MGSVPENMSIAITRRQWDVLVQGCISVQQSTLSQLSADITNGHDIQRCKQLMDYALEAQSLRKYLESFIQ